MMDFSKLDWSNLANALVILFTGLAAGVGWRAGKRAIQAEPATPPAAHLELGGALIDSSSARQVAAAIEAATLEGINMRKSLERAAEDIRDELHDLTKSIDGLKTEVARDRR